MRDKRGVVVVGEVGGCGGGGEGLGAVGGGYLSPSLAASEGLNDCRGADVCCSHIKQQLVCRNKLQGYWFTLHLPP